MTADEKFTDISVLIFLFSKAERPLKMWILFRKQLLESKERCGSGVMRNTGRRSCVQNRFFMAQD